MMRGIDLIGADEGGLIDAGAGAAKGLVTYFKRPEAPAAPKPDAKKKPPADAEEGWFSRPLVAPVKRWHAILAAALAGVGAYFWKRK